jgi:3-hydroxyisobutyrate dehydrogenase-like beta-hydroxyacid dehydrogenase
MGYPMAGHLARAGHHVTVYNRSAAKATAWAAECPGNATAPTPREAAAGADIVFACVGNDADLRSVVLGQDGAFAGMKPGAIFVDHTTASAEIARELYAEAQKLGLHFVDAPVSGGQAGAQNGMLTVMCGGDAAAFDAVKPAAMALRVQVSWPRWSTRSASRVWCKACPRPWPLASKPASICTRCWT